MGKFKVQSLKCKVAGVFSTAVVLAGILFAGDAAAMLTAKANHDHITIDFFYHGSTVSVRGESEPGVDLVIKIASPEGRQVFKQKGKVGGVLWMNVGQLTFERTPGFYGIYSTKKLDDLLSRDERDRYVLGYQALLRHVDIAPLSRPAEKAKWFDEFVKYQEDSNVYAESAGRVELKTNDKGRQEYYIMTQWPHQAAPGDYIVTVYAVRDNKVVERAESRVKVEQVGMVKTLASMAENSAAFYGFLSVGVALGAGFGVGLVFRKGGGSH